MKPCLDYMELMNAVLDGEATPVQEAELTAHLAACAPCAALFEDLKTLRDGADALVTEAPAGFAGTVMDRVRAEAGRPQIQVLPQKKKRPVWRSLASVAAVCAVVLLGATSLNDLDFAWGGSTAASAPEAAPAAMDSAVESKVYGAAGESQQAPTFFSADSASRGVEGTADSKSMAEPNQAAPAQAAPAETGVPAGTADPAENQRMENVASDAAGEAGAALELVLEKVYGGSGYTAERTYSADGLSCTVRLLDGETLIDEGEVAYTGLSPNGKFFCFAWTWQDQSVADADLFRYAVPTDLSDLLWAGETLDGGAAFRGALEE